MLKNFYITIIIFFLLGNSIYAKEIKCDFFINKDVRVADGRTNYKDVQPGDTVCIEGGTRGFLQLKNFRGSATSPIQFININGQVEISSTEYTGISIGNSQYFHLSGTGTENIIYGFKVVSSSYTGLGVMRKSDNYEIDHVEIANIPHIGIQAGTDDATCSNATNNNYDYDGDGSFLNDLGDVVNRGNYTQTNIVFHNNYIHNLGTEGFYIGSSFYQEGVTMNCVNRTEKVMQPLLKGVKIYDNKIENTGRDALQVGSATENCDIYNNNIYKNSQDAVEFQQSGIMNNKGSVCNIFNNFIKDGGPGIFAQGNGGNNIFNNVVINSGSNNGGGGNGIGVVNGTNIGNSINVWNNTIINPLGYGIGYYNNIGNNNIQNNLIITTKNFEYIEKISSVNTSNNYTNPDISAVKFIDPNNDNYALQSNSPAIDMGVIINNNLLNKDYLGHIRPNGTKPDAGAVEYWDTSSGGDTGTDPILGSGNGSGGGSTGSTSLFRDLDSSHVFYPFIKNLVLANIVRGFSDNTFRADTNVSREAMAKFIKLGFGIPTDTSCTPFSDIPSNHQFFEEITTLKCKGIINGYADNTYRPSNFVTRAEAMKFVVKGARFVKGNNDFLPISKENKFPDVLSDNLFYNEILSGYSNDIINGYPEGNFGPNDPITRGAMAKIVDNTRLKLQ